MARHGAHEPDIGRGSAPVAVAGLDTTHKGYPSISGDEAHALYYEQGTMTGLSVLPGRARDPERSVRRNRRARPGFPAMADEARSGIRHDRRPRDGVRYVEPAAGSIDLYLVTRGCQYASPDSNELPAGSAIVGNTFGHSGAKGLRRLIVEVGVAARTRTPRSSSRPLSLLFARIATVPSTCGPVEAPRSPPATPS